ncbi:MAG: flavodoxin [Lachnospiraceae bacterium]|nr:flavodoxin [Lachnospiraceae bacterium]
MDYMVVYSSVTGNTKKIATEIFSALPGMSKDMQSIEEYKGKDADIFFIGFWVNRGTCDISVIDLLSDLHGKKIALFGTCGMGKERAYFKTIEQKVNVWIPDDCEYLGTFLCQGKMPMQVRENYEIPMEDSRQEMWRKRMLHNFDEGLFHPNEEDLAHVREFVGQVLERVRK